ncbi:methionine synthase [Paenibacillus sp. IB182496]|uniref:Methionine synthase n=1 Tax=Paenibacillus sabuli TaxID=2772509 RepID=A0A927BYA7_9BACL|nr:methionine synthase [Paenibacillus sabuli]MBD2847970.1 methionine synthase [Paenibacillus sabuli]
MTKSTLYDALKQRILIMDGAMGTMIQQADLQADAFGGEDLDGCNEILVLTRPDLIRDIHEDYLEAGADIIETNTFGATSVVLMEYDIPEKARELNLAAAALAREAADKYATPERPRYVAGALGPTTKTLSVTGGVTFDGLVESYLEQTVALIEGGVDAILLETSQDTLNVKAGSIAIRRAFEQTGRELPIMISGTIEPMGTTLAGQSIEAFYISLEHLKPISVGLNCATGPEFMRDHIRSLSEIAGSAVSCYPNAGLPDENGQYHESPQSLATKLGAFAEQGWLNIAGGCCGTTPAHIRALAEQMAGYAPRQANGSHPPAVSGIETVYIEEDNRPIMIGERTNISGSRKFKRLIKEEKFDEASDIARAQVKGGAQIIDINLQDTDIDEAYAVNQFLPMVAKKIKAPLMLDSTYDHIIELGLKYSQGKAIINSINLEDGESKFEQILPLIHQYGAAVVCILIDERGQAVSRQAKLEVAERAYRLLVDKYGMQPCDIIFDPNMFPVGSGDPQYIGSAVETLEGIRLIKQTFPETKTILGLSNISFGLPDAGREVLNSVYLYEATKAGLDYAIVNTEKLERYASIPEEERRLAEDLIYRTSDETLATFVAAFREKKVVKKEKVSNLTLEERLSAYVVEGSKDGLLADLDEALKTKRPLEIINGPLMKGMDEVGRLFNNNELIVAEVLQSAEVMKASVAHLEPYMEKSDTSVKGKIILATVKGDVHDIGKNLVEIILSNNGYRIINLGIKVAPEQLIEAYRNEPADAIGLSGLLVKSAQQMVVTAQDLRNAEIAVPILVGGAALTRKFTKNRIGPEYEGLVLYAKDAMDGLDIANKLMDKAHRGRMEQEHAEYKASGGAQVEEKPALPKLTRTKRSAISQTVSVFVPPDLQRHVLRDVPIPHIVPYVNMQMLLGHHLGVKGSVEQLLAAGDAKTRQLKETVDELLQEAASERLLRAHAMYRFFPAQSSGNDVIIYDPEDHAKEIKRFTFPRQQVEPFLCLSDYLRPVDSGEMDYVGFLVVTAGSGIRERAEVLKDNGDYLRSHAIQAVALEVAEGLAERVHHIMRDIWGYPDPQEMTMKQRHGARYQGIRVSFGYPACPNLEDQGPLFELMQPQDIGVELTEGFMMEPEASVSAMVFAHPEAQYFNVEKS